MGFSLAELMVVVALLALLLAFSSPALLTTRALNLSTATRDAGAFFEVARSRARSLGRPIRILIQDGETDQGGYRQKLIHAIATGEGNWRADGNPLLLPEDVVFDDSQPGTTRKRMSFAPGGRAPIPWFYYEISADGSVEDGGRSFVLASGEVSQGSVQVPNPAAIQGFRISRNGRLLYFRTPEEIEEVAR